MKEMRGNINGIAKEYVEEMFKNKNGIMSPAELHFATLSNSVNRYRISFLSSVYTTGKWNLMAENPTEETAEFCQLDKSAGKEYFCSGGDSSIKCGCTENLDSTGCCRYAGRRKY